MRRVSFLLLALFLSFLGFSQVTASFGNFFTTNLVQKSYEKYDASDVIGNGDIFNRLALSVTVLSKHELSTVLDFGAFGGFQNHQITYQYWLKENMFVGFVHQNMTYYVDDNTFLDQTSSSYYGYLKSRQIGLTAGATKKASAFEFQLSPQILFGGSPKSKTFSDLIFSETNKRSLREETFRIDNMVSLKLQGSVTWQVFHVKDFAFKIKYTGGIKHDWFAFENHSAFYEWTRSNALVDERYKVRHRMIQLQNEIALVVGFN